VPKSELERNLDTLPTTLVTTHANPETSHPLSFRKNRFVSIGENPAPLIDKKLESHDNTDESGKTKDEGIDSSDSE